MRGFFSAMARWRADQRKGHAQVQLNWRCRQGGASRGRRSLLLTALGSTAALGVQGASLAFLSEPDRSLVDDILTAPQQPPRDFRSSGVVDVAELVLPYIPLGTSRLHATRALERERFLIGSADSQRTCPACDAPLLTAHYENLPWLPLAPALSFIRIAVGFRQDRAILVTAEHAIHRY